MNRYAILALFLMAVDPVAAQPDCAAVVSDTLEEMRLGAAEPWTPAEEAVARGAASSACLKASSGRYGDTLLVESIDPVAGGAKQGDAPVVPTEGGADDGDNGGIRFTPMTGSPGQKPYERSRSGDK